MMLLLSSGACDVIASVKHKAVKVMQVELHATPKSAATALSRWHLECRQVSARSWSGALAQACHNEHKVLLHD